MQYAIETLEIELNKLKQAQRDEDYWTVHPQYNPPQIEWKARMIEIMKAIDILRGTIK